MVQLRLCFNTNLDLIKLIGIGTFAKVNSRGGGMGKDVATDWFFRVRLKAHRCTRISRHLVRDKNG